MLASDLEALQAFAGSFGGFHCIAIFAKENRKKIWAEPDLAEWAESTIKSIHSCRQKAFLAGVEVGQSIDSMRQLLKSCIDAVYEYKRTEPTAKRNSAFVAFEKSFNICLSELNDVILCAERQLANQKASRESQLRGQKPKNDELLVFAEESLKTNPYLTDKEILNEFKKRTPNHPIFSADDPRRALRAARSRKRKKESSS